MISSASSICNSLQEGRRSPLVPMVSFFGVSHWNFYIGWNCQDLFQKKSMWRSSASHASIGNRFYKPCKFSDSLTRIYACHEFRTTHLASFSLSYLFRRRWALFWLIEIRKYFNGRWLTVDALRDTVEAFSSLQSITSLQKTSHEEKNTQVAPP